MVDRSLRPADGDVIIASVEISPERSEHCEAMSLEGCDFTVKTYRRDKSGVRPRDAPLRGRNPDAPRPRVGEQRVALAVEGVADAVPLRPRRADEAVCLRVLLTVALALRRLRRPSGACSFLS